MPDIRKWDEVNGADDLKEAHLKAFVESVNDSYAILQIVRSEETMYEMFESYAMLQGQGKEPDPDHYEVVYHDPLKNAPATPEETSALLESPYVKLNTGRHPYGYEGHSLSVSDIVALKVAGEVSCHYVDRIGFKELENFVIRENYLKNAEMAVEDDCGMIDGINNGKKEEPAGERRSIFDDLKAFSGSEPPEKKQPHKQAARDER